ncbi:MAG TPA: hypothetical protein VM284_01575 [Candidatus Limnocylindria bacterium]|nr:hypothetical protein [Candidatus Limnocylindria bacterium]
MELGILIGFALGAAFVVFALYGIYAGIRRMQGHPTRFDGSFETFVRSQRAGVYPASLRGDPDPPIQEAAEISRGDAAARSTPGESRDKP